MISPRDRANIALPTAFRPTIDVGSVRVAVGGPHGALVELPLNLAATPGLPRRPEAREPSPPVVLRADSVAAVWDRIAGGAIVVTVGGRPGAGATTLLHVLAAGATEHGFSGDALLVSGARGPARDIAQRIAALIAERDVERYSSASDLARIADGSRRLILIDRAELDPAERSELAALFPTFCFVIVLGAMPADAPDVALGPLPAADALTLLQAAYGRPVDDDNRQIAHELAASVGSLPGAIRLIGIAARELRRSFISLQLQFRAGAVIVAELIARLPAAERRILGILGLARTPLAGYQVAYVARSGNIDALLTHLTACELVRSIDGGCYILANVAAPHVPPLPDADFALGRIVDVLCDAFDPAPTEAGIDRQVASAEALLEALAADSQDRSVLVLGARLATALASRGAFGAWGRVLVLMETSAERLDDRAALAYVRHDLGIRALLLGESDRAGTFLRTTARDRAAAGDDAGAAASTAALELAERANSVAAALPAAGLPAAALPAAASAPGDVPADPPSRPPTARRLALLACFIAAFAVGGLLVRPHATAAPEIRDFSAHPVAVAGGRAVELCVDAVDTAVVEIFPAAARLPGDGAHCVLVRPTETTTYVAIGTASDGGRVQRMVTVPITNVPPPPRIATFSATPAHIRPGQSTRLCYVVTDAHLLRIVPRVGPLTRLAACSTVTLHEPHHYRYELSATGDDGHVTARSVQVDVVAPHSPVPARAVARDSGDERAARAAVYQFDATPASVARGQAASLCVGVGRPAHGFVTHVGRLEPGITRCYRVQPQATTVYRLYVTLQNTTAVESVTVAVHPPNSRRDVARTDHH